MKSNRYSEYNKMNTELLLVVVTVGVAIILGWSPNMQLFSQVACAISYTKYLNGTMTITYDNGTSNTTTWKRIIQSTQSRITKI